MRLTQVQMAGEKKKKNGREITTGIQIDYTRANVKIMQMSFTSEWDPRDERGYN